MNKINRTLDIIYRGLESPNRSAIAWSGGKDSMVLLHIMRNMMGLKFPIIFFREPWQPWKYKFQDKIIQDWGLEVYTWHPMLSAMQQSEGEFEVQNVYKFNTTTMSCPSGITEPVQGKPWVCGIDMLKRPKQESLIAPWDTVWIGHKAVDSDPIYGGDAGTRIECRINPDQSTMFFPLRDWTHLDIWEFIENANIPIDLDRYEKVNGVWGEKIDKLLNVDYVHACVKCLDKRENAPKFVHCPKLDMTVENCANRVPWFNQTLPTYMKD
jgi:hypothetical protein